MSRIARAVVPALFVLLPALAACGSTTADQPPATTAGPATTSQLPREQAEEICSVKDSAGTYFLKITSYGDGDLSACAGGTQFKGDLDTLINMPTVDRRCIISPPKGPYRAIVGVYSSTRTNDESAARARCAADNGEDYGNG